MSSTPDDWDPGQGTPAAQAAPFWQRMPRFFRFPAYRAPLARNLILSLGLTAALVAPWQSITALAALVATLYLTYYGFVVIERSAQGFLYPDEYPAALEHTGVWRPLKMFVILMAAFFTIGVVTALAGDGTLTMLAYAVSALLLPGSVMTLAVSNRLRQAINPLRVFGLARKIGAPYLVLFLFLLLLMGGSQQAFELIAPLLGESLWLLALVSSLVGNYFFLIMCALMGYVLYQYSDVLDLTVIGPGEARPSAARWTNAELQARRRDARLGRLVAAGDVRSAIELVEAALAQQPADLPLHARLHKLLLLDGDAVRIESHADRWFDLMLKAGHDAEGVVLVDAMLARRYDWSPRPGHVAPLARAALAAGKAELAVRLTCDFEQRHPGHEAVPDVKRLHSLAMNGADASPVEARQAAGRHDSVSN